MWNNIDQNELVKRYCREADSLLSTAPDRAAALRLRDTLCQRFQEECKSDLVVNATREYITQTIRRMFGDKSFEGH